MLPEVFKNKKPKIFASLENISRIKERSEDWSPLLEKSCNQIYDYGVTFIEQFNKTNCQYNFNYNGFMDTSNSLLGGRYNPDTNQIHIGECSFDSKKEFLEAFFHEGIHAIQHNICASLNINPSTTNIPLVLSPKSLLIQHIYVELDAHSKHRFFSYLYDFIDIEDTSNLDLWMSNNGNVQRYIYDTAQAISQNNTFFNYEGCVDTALDYCELFAKWYHKTKRNNIQFVKLGKSDLWNLGNSLNINSLYNDYNEIVLNPEIQMNNKQMKRLEVIDKSLGIEKEEDLPSFGETLREHNLTRKEFIKIIKS